MIFAVAQVLRALPYPRRFALYAHWRDAAYANDTAPELLFAKAEAMRRTKYFQAREGGVSDQMEGSQ